MLSSFSYDSPPFFKLETNIPCKWHHINLNLSNFTIITPATKCGMPFRPSSRNPISLSENSFSAPLIPQSWGKFVLGDTPKTPGRITHPLFPSQEGKILHLFSGSLTKGYVSPLLSGFPLPDQVEDKLRGNDMKGDYVLF